MFTLINYIENPVLEIGMSSIGPDLYNTYIIMTNVISSIAAIPGWDSLRSKRAKNNGNCRVHFLRVGVRISQHLLRYRNNCIYFIYGI